MRVAIRTWWRRYWWAALGATGALAIFLAFIGAEGGFFSRVDTTLRILPIGYAGGGLTVRAPPVLSEDPSLALRVARLLVPFVFAYVAYKALRVVFAERWQDVRARFAKGHVIVNGLGDQGQELTASLLGKTKVVAVECDTTNGAVQRLRDEGAIVLRGDATTPELLQRAGISRARCIVTLCGSDAVNAQVAANVLQTADQRAAGEELHAFVHVADPRLYTFLLHHALSGEGPQLEFFNVYERAARGFLGEGGRYDDPEAILVAGGGQLGLALLSLMARERSERRVREPQTGKLRVHLIDRDADARLKLLRDRYSRFDEVCTVVSMAIDVTSPAFDRLLERTPELAEVDAAYVCFDDDTLTVSTTLGLLDQARGRFPIVARVSHRSAGIAAMLESAKSEYAGSASFRPLSLAQSCRGDVVLEGMRGQLARRVHDTYRAGAPGGPYDVPWDELTDEGRSRNLSHAAAIVVQLEAVGYHLGPLIDWGKAPLLIDPADVDRMAELEHGRWVDERVRGDWRYGATRNDETRVHPDLVPWADLPRDRQDINRRLVSERPSMLAAIGIELYRG